MTIKPERPDLETLRFYAERDFLHGEAQADDVLWLLDMLERASGIIEHGSYDIDAKSLEWLEEYDGGQDED